MRPINQVERLKQLLNAAQCEERARIRAWLMSAFDDCGIPRQTDEGVTDAKEIDLEKLVRTNLRAPRVTWLPSKPSAPAPEKCIYAIASECDWLYVGYTTRVGMRRSHHIAALRNGRHSNRLLQRHWNNDSGAMWFVILESLDGGCERRRRGAQDPSEIAWKRRLRPLYDREAKPADVSFLIVPVTR